jgi:hypothetical protein
VDRLELHGFCVHRLRHVCIECSSLVSPLLEVDGGLLGWLYLSIFLPVVGSI